MKNNEKKSERSEPQQMQMHSPEAERLRRLETCANLGMIEWNIENGTFWCSEQICPILDIKDTTPDNFQSFIGFFHPTDQINVQKAFEQITQDRAPFQITSKIITTSGSETPILLKGTHNESLPGIIGYIQDISSDFQERESLLGTLAKYRGVMDSAGDAIILISQKGTILEGNPKACELLEVSETEISNLSVDDIHKAESLEVMMGHYQGMIWGQTERVESTILGQKGKETIVEITGRPVTIASHEMIVVIYHDVTLQYQAQNALKRSEQRYRSLVDEAREGILLLNENGKILAANPKVCESLKIKRRNLLNHNFLEIADFDLDLSPIEILTKSSKRQSIHMEGHLITKHNEMLPTGFNVARYIEQGKVRYSVTAYDLSEVRAGEEDRLQLQKQLFQSQKQELMGQLAGSLAHDFNNLLSPILLVSETLMEDTEEDPFLKKNLGNINQAAQRARRLVARILEYTRPEDSSPKLLNLKSEISETLSLLRASVPQSIQITDSFSHESYRCFADPDQIHQVIMNVGTNAAQAIGEETGHIHFLIEKIDITEKCPLMKIHEIPEGNYAKISIFDDGPGFDEKHLNEIFEPFFTTKTQTDGTGLGLSVVKRIISNHGGCVEAYNQNNGGACLCLYLPLIGELK
ncbi:MAG: PAS domain S-box protein [Methylocystaceae bacterium]|nr:PAS domain S-box protein [Methylocystaceae bacterium]